MSKLLQRIEQEIAQEVLKAVGEEAFVVLDRSTHPDECLAYVHAVIRKTELRYGFHTYARDPVFVPADIRSGLSADPLVPEEPTQLRLEEVL